MSLRWEISNKVQRLKGWAGRRFGRLTGNRRRQIAGKAKPAGGKARDAFKR
ncbi:hypothetical protein [Nonomuraea sp. GTA35]|uniref:CsbD family protein n=1 Tax=Nonomuraea sp. GTA35 TaxID=1676746 RepID=UPI0035C1393D